MSREREVPQVMIQIGRERSRLLAVRQRHLEAFVGETSRGGKRRLAALYAGIRQANDFLRTLDEIARSVTPAVTAVVRPRYAVSSLFLYDSFRKLTADRSEQFFFVTGAELGGALVLGQWAEFDHDERTVVSVKADQRSTHRVLIRLEQFGHRLLAHFHSHPGNGPSSTRPSGIDEGFQARLESAGHLAAMAIFSRDGFVRFIRMDGTPEVEIYGKGVEEHDRAQAVFRLTEIDNA